MIASLRKCKGRKNKLLVEEMNNEKTRNWQLDKKSMSNQPNTIPKETKERYRGPFTISKVNNDNTVEVEDKRKRKFKYHINSLKLGFVYLYIEEALSKHKRAVCKFCRINVTNFEQHLLRHRLDEKEVTDFLQIPTTTKEGRQMRRSILALLGCGQI